MVLILLTDIFSTAGGIQRFNRNLIRGLNNSFGLDSIKKIFSLVDTKPPPNDLFIPNPAQYLFFSNNKIKYILYAAKEFLKKPEYIFFGHIHLSPLALLAKVITPKSKIINIVYGFEAWEKIRYSKLIGLKVTDLILSISDFTKDQFCFHNPIPREKVQVIHLSLDSDWSSINDKNPEYLQDVDPKPFPFILSVSRLDKIHGHYKGIDNVITAMDILRTKGALGDYRYIIIGDGDDIERLKLLAKENDLEDRLIFTGRVDDLTLRKFYKNCEIFALPSKGEGFGLVYLEAMAHGKPVIAGRYGAPNEIVIDGETGFLVDHGDYDMLSEKLRILINSSDLREEMGFRGKECLERHFTFSHFQKNLENILIEFFED